MLNLSHGMFSLYGAIWLAGYVVGILLNSVALWVLTRFVAKRRISLVLAFCLSVAAIVIPVPIAMVLSALSARLGVDIILSGLAAFCVSLLVPAVLYANFVKTPENSPIGLAKGLILTLCCFAAVLIMAIPVSLIAAFVTILLGGLK